MGEAPILKMAMAGRNSTSLKTEKQKPAFKIQPLSEVTRGQIAFMFVVHVFTRFSGVD
jgi:hypothetical protein